MSIERAMMACVSSCAMMRSLLRPLAPAPFGQSAGSKSLKSTLSVHAGEFAAGDVVARETHGGEVGLTLDEFDFDRCAVTLDAEELLHQCFAFAQPGTFERINDVEFVGGRGFWATGDDGRATQTPAQDLHAVEIRRGTDAIDLGDELRDFRLQRLAIAGAVGRVRRLQGEFAAALQQVGHFREATFAGLKQGHRIHRIPRRLVEAADLRGHTLGNGQAGRIVARGIDPQARRQPLQAARQAVVRTREHALRVQRRDVAVYLHLRDPSIRQINGAVLPLCNRVLPPGAGRLRESRPVC
jgi:hypothetical protein